MIMADRRKVIASLQRMSTYFKSMMAVGWQGDMEVYQKHRETVNMAIELLKEHEKTGHWTTKRTIQHDGEWYCDRCDYEPTVFEDTPFCPNCGAKMEGR